MLARYGARNPNRLLSGALIALALANVIAYVLQRKSGLPESVTDPLTGFVYGVAIATTLLAIHLRVRASRQQGSRS